MTTKKRFYSYINNDNTEDICQQPINKKIKIENTLHLQFTIKKITNNLDVNQQCFLLTNVNCDKVEYESNKWNKISDYECQNIIRKNNKSIFEYLTDINYIFQTKNKITTPTFLDKHKELCI